MWNNRDTEQLLAIVADMTNSVEDALSEIAASLHEVIEIIKPQDKQPGEVEIKLVGAAEVPECVQIPRTINLVPPNSWLHDEKYSWCPTCHAQIKWGSSSMDEEYKIQHQLWHYQIARLLLAENKKVWAGIEHGGTPDKPQKMPDDEPRAGYVMKPI